MDIIGRTVSTLNKDGGYKHDDTTIIKGMCYHFGNDKLFAINSKGVKFALYDEILLGDTSKQKHTKHITHAINK